VDESVGMVIFRPEQAIRGYLTNVSSNLVRFSVDEKSREAQQLLFFIHKDTYRFFHVL
jgi:hypothetical protein